MRFIYLGALLCTFSLAQAQSEGTLSGFIFDDKNYEAIIGANIYFEDIAIGSSTNTNGYYVVSNIPSGTYTLVVSYLGYKTHKEKIEIKGGENSKKNVILKPEALEADAIVVTADSVSVAEQLYKKPISVIKLNAAQISAIPQIGEADLLRSLQTLPGIQPLSDFSSALYIRGGTPDQNLYLLDGTDVYNPEHAFGLFSTFNTDAIKQVDLSKGGFTADRGGRLSSIIDITNVDGNRKEFKGKANISLLSAKTTLQMPLGKKGSISGSFRRTYFDQTIAKAIDEVPDYYFYDGNIKAFWDIDENNNLTVSGYGGRDVLDIVFNSAVSDEIGFKYSWGNRTGSVQWTHIFSPKLFSNFWVTASRFDSDFDFQSLEIYEKNKLDDITAKGNLEYHYNNDFDIKFGFEHKQFDVHYLSEAPGRDIFIKSKPTHSVGYVHTNWRPEPLMEIQAGLRFNYYKDKKAYTNIAPRFAIKYRLDSKSNVRFSTGIYHQYLHRIRRFFITDIWTTSNQDLIPSTSHHYILGYQRELAYDIGIEVEAYYKKFQDIYSFDQNFLTKVAPTSYNEKDEPVFTTSAPLLKRGDGNSFGFEVLLRKDVGLLNGWIGYSYSETEFTIPGTNKSRPYAPRHDRRHTVNLVNKIDLDAMFDYFAGQKHVPDSSRWEFGLNLVYATGQPFTEPGSGYLTGGAPGSTVPDIYFAPTQINQIRLPYYARLDVSLKWLITYRTWKMAPYIQIFNAGNRKNAWFATYSYEDFQPVIETQPMFPLLPSIGIEFDF